MGWAVTSILVLSGCAVSEAPAVDKAGAQTLVLNLATIDVVNNNGESFGPQAFVDGLETVSGGRLKAVVTEKYLDGQLDGESELVKAIASGAVDGGWPSTRAFPRAGIPGLEAVEAPLTLTNYAAVKALVSGPVATDLLDRIRGTGIVALGLAVGPLRRPFAAQAPLLSPADWQGISFRSFNSPVQDDTIRALGGSPVEAGSDWTSRVTAGQLRGAEFDVAQYKENEYTSEAPYVTANVVLWPKVFVFALSQKRWDSMTDEQRSWVEQAAQQATKASVTATYDETTPARGLCDSGVRFVDASSSQLTATRAAVAPVIERLAADQVDGPLLAKILAIAARYPGIDEPDVPPGCQTLATPSPSPTIPTTVSAIPSGIYRAQVTLADVSGAGLNNGLGWTGTWTLEIKDGTFRLTCRALNKPGVDCGNIDAFVDTQVAAGRVLGSGHTVYFVDNDPRVNPPYWVDWSLSGDGLVFSNLGGAIGGLGVTIRPWTRIG